MGVKLGHSHTKGRAQIKGVWELDVGSVWPKEGKSGGWLERTA
jgi:hypothetical protein